MNTKVFCTLFLAGNIAVEECVMREGKPHIEFPRYQEEPRLTYFVNSTATAALVQPLWYIDFK